MRYILMHRTAPEWEAGMRPSMKLITEMGQLMGELARSGNLVGGDGLRASSLGVRLNFDGGVRTVTPGPFVGRNELVAGFAIVQTTTMDEAVVWATRYAEQLGDIEIDIRPVTEAWDLGFGDKPADLTTTRYMLQFKATPRSEAGVPLPAAVVAGIERLTAEMTQAGVFLSAQWLQPSATGVRHKYVSGTRTVTDGPFTESKELIAGFVIVNARSVTEAQRWAGPFAQCVGDVELDIRPLYEPPQIA